MRKGKEICLVSTGYMTHSAVGVADMLVKEGIAIGVVDVFLLKPLNDDLFFEAVEGYKCVMTIEEAFVKKGGLDSLVAGILNDRNSNIRLVRMGFNDAYVFDIGNRAYLHRLNNLDAEGIAINIREILNVL